MAVFYFFLISGLMLIVLEIATTTFYLLIIGISFILASLFALKFNQWPLITILAVIFAIIGTLIIYLYKQKHVANGKMLIQHIGNTVEIVEITKNNLRVLYSGSYWNAHLKTHTDQELKIGDKLVITKFSNNELEVNVIG